MRTFVGIVILFSLLLAGTMRAQQPVPVGNEFQVNTETTGNQRWPSLAVDSGGTFTVVWYEHDYIDIRAQRYGQDGTPIGDEFRVVSPGNYDGGYPSVAADAAGNFVVVWGVIISHEIYGRRFGSDGAPIGNDFQINTYTAFIQEKASVAVEPDGDFVVVWESQGSSGSDTSEWSWSVQGQRYASDGMARGGQFQINSYTTGHQVWPSVAVEPDGDFVVVWESGGSGGSATSGSSIQGQRYASDGTARGGEFQINSYTTYSQRWPSVAVAPVDGSFVTVWQSGSVGTDYSIQGQRYASDGTARGGEFQVNTYTTNDQRLPAVTVEPEGDFVVVWQSYGSSGSDTSSTSIQGQRYTSDGAPSGDEFQVNTYTTLFQESPSVAALPMSGTFVTVWQSYGSSGIQGQRFSAALVDLSISVDDGATQATPGQAVTYTIVAANPSPTDVVSVAVTDSFPGELTCSWTSVPAGGATGNTSSSGNLNDTLNMPAGSSVIYTATCAIDPTATGTLSNTAMISSAFTDPNPANSSATDADTVLVPESDLAVIQADVPDPVYVNDSLTYTITVSNQGPSFEPLVVVTDVLPPEVSYVGVEAPGWNCIHVSGTVACSRSNLDVGPTPAITVTVNAPAYATVITNNVGVSGAEIDPVSGNNSSAETTTIQSATIFDDGFESGDTSAWSSAVP